jgi:uncharacterized membrane protein YfcA
LATVLTLAFLIEAAVAAVAGVVRGFSGFGAALIMAPGFLLVVSPQDAVVMTVLLNFMTITQLLGPALRQVNWRELGPMGLAGMAGVPLGSVLLIAVDGGVIRRVIGAVVLGFSVAMLAGWRYTGPRTRGATLVVGALGGMLTGSAGVGGPPVILYLLSNDRPMAESRAGFIVFFTFIQLAALPVFLVAGLVSWRLLGHTALLVPLYLIATHVGARLFARANEALARRLALGLLVVIGLATLVR